MVNFSFSHFSHRPRDMLKSILLKGTVGSHNELRNEIFMIFTLKFILFYCHFFIEATFEFLAHK